MPFVEFENSLGSGWVIPDESGGTVLRYFPFKLDDSSFTRDNVIKERVKVRVEPLDDRSGVVDDHLPVDPKQRP